MYTSCTSNCFRIQFILPWPAIHRECEVRPIAWKPKSREVSQNAHSACRDGSTFDTFSSGQCPDRSFWNLYGPAGGSSAPGRYGRPAHSQSWRTHQRPGLHSGRSGSTSDDRHLPRSAGKRKESRPRPGDPPRRLERRDLQLPRLMGKSGVLSICAEPRGCRRCACLSAPAIKCG